MITILMHILANPNRFVKIARLLTPWLVWGGALLILVGMVAGLFFTPPDYLQGDSARIMYVHVPMAWLAMAGWTGIALASLAQIVWRHPLANVAGRAIAIPGAAFTFLCLVTGSLWGRPTWGTYWEWDGRMTSMLILLFLYIGYIALASADQERGGEGRITAIFGLLGVINIPIIHYSVIWWNSLHQGQSINFINASSSIDETMLWPLFISAMGYSILFAGIVLMRMRAMLAYQKIEARLRRKAR